MLAHATLSRNPFTFAEVWRRSTDLELSGDLFIEWENYTKALSEKGITLQEESRDSLLWTGGDASGRMTVKNFYNAIHTIHGLPSWSGWRVQVWKWRLQLKIVFFFWRATEDKILLLERQEPQRLHGILAYLQGCLQKTSNPTELVYLERTQQVIIWWEDPLCLGCGYRTLGAHSVSPTVIKSQVLRLSPINCFLG